MKNFKVGDKGYIPTEYCYESDRLDIYPIVVLEVNGDGTRAGTRLKVKYDLKPSHAFFVDKDDVCSTYEEAIVVIEQAIRQTISKAYDDLTRVREVHKDK